MVSDTAGDLLADLSEEQAAVVTSPAAPLAIVAGPGSGKTRVLTRRIAWQIRQGRVEASHVLALTFSRRAASELGMRLRRLGLPAGARDAGVTTGTFHAVAWAELSRHRVERGQAPVSVLARPTRLLTPALTAALGRAPSATELSAAAREITWARLQQLNPQGYPAVGQRRWRNGLTPAAISAAWAGYERAKRDRRVLDLDDLLETCTRLLTTDPEAGAAARWRHRHLFVDEYQDLNPAHHRLLRAWVGERPDLCLVGDPDQAVYGFNGASPDLFATVEQDWPGVEIVHLTDNFRSTPEVVALAEAVRPTRVGALPCSSVRPPGPLPVLRSYRDDHAEAQGVADAILARRAPGKALGGTAVLARTNARLRLVAAALDHAGIPWRLRDLRPLADRPPIQAWLRQLPAHAPSGDLRELVAGSVDTRPTDSADGLATDRAALLGALSEFASGAPAATVAGFANWLDATGITAEEGPAPGIDLATFHRAKGLEWPSIWVVGVEEGLVPLAGSGGAALAEERRLLYVALTRGEEEVTISWARQRTARDNTVVDSQPSRWIADLGGRVATLGHSPQPPEQLARLSDLRHALAPPHACARRLALLTWREHRARAARIPVDLILPDRLVDALVVGTTDTEDDVRRLTSDLGSRAALWAPEVLRILRSAG
ncbi:MAG: ATP-dependent DNA helicase UvrD2 [Acidimicrobiales bacterium]